MKQKDNKKNYNKEFFIERVKDYIKYRTIGYSIDEIEYVFNKDYGIKDISTFRKAADILENTGNIEVNVDSKIGLEKIAIAKKHLIVDRKINVIANRELHKEANSQAKWLGVIESIKEHNFTQYKLNKPHKTKSCKGLKDVIYILGDFHYRGSVDDNLIKQTFETINNEIATNGYEDVELWFTGDYIDGEIHEGQQRYNEPLTKCSIKLANMFIEYINQISNITSVKCVPGNHDEVRLWGEKNTENNMAELIAAIMKQGLRKDISFQYGVELFFDYKDKKIMLTHGHYSYCKSKSKLIEHCDIEHGCQPNIMVLGHFHSSKTTQFSRNRWLIVAPAIKDWMSNWDRDHSYCGFGQLVRLKLNLDSPQITTVNVTKEVRK